jgi:hypothetical protein
MEMCFSPTVFLCFWTKIPKSCFFLTFISNKIKFVSNTQYGSWSIAGAFFNADTSIPSFLHNFFQWGFYLHTLTAVSQLLYQNVFFRIDYTKILCGKTGCKYKNLIL